MTNNHTSAELPKWTCPDCCQRPCSCEIYPKAKTAGEWSAEGYYSVPESTIKRLATLIDKALSVPEPAPPAVKGFDEWYDPHFWHNRTGIEPYFYPWKDDAKIIWQASRAALLAELMGEEMRKRAVDAYCGTAKRTIHSEGLDAVFQAIAERISHDV